MLRNYKNLPWPTNLWSAIFCQELTSEQLPADWELVLEYAVDTIKSHKCQEIVLYFFRDGKTLREIGSIYGNTNEAIRQHLEQALRTFRHPSRVIFFQSGMEAGRRTLWATSKPRPQTPDPADPESIDRLNLSARSWNCLKRHGINTIVQLSGLTANELLSFRNMGATSVREIQAKLADHGLTLHPEGG